MIWHSGRIKLFTKNTNFNILPKMGTEGRNLKVVLAFIYLLVGVTPAE